MWAFFFMDQNKIYNRLLSYLEKEHLKDFENEINALLRISENHKNPRLLNLYGLFVEIKKDFNKAIQIFVKCINLDKNLPAPYFNLGRIYLHFKIYKTSINFFEQYLDLIKKDHFEGEYFLARAYYFNYQYRDAISLLNKVLSKYENILSEPQRIEILNLTGSSYTLNKDLNSAVSFYKRALMFDKNNIITLGNLANAYRSLGKIDDASKLFYTALKIDNKNPNLHKDLSVLLKYKDKNDPHLNEMLKLYNSHNYSKKDKIDLGFAIGKAYDDLNLPNEASKYLINSNNERRLQLKYDFKNEIKEYELHYELFSNLKRDITNKSKEKITPIFILGMPRSGTTLVEQILSSHSEVEAGDEIFFLADSVQKSFIHKSYDEFLNSFNNNTNEKLKKLSELYLSELHKISNNKKFVTDKMPLNFKMIGLIYYAIPNAKVIHCVRDGRDTCLSIYKNNFSIDKLAWAYDQEELSKFFNLYVDYMKLWKNLYGDFIFDFKYEKIINDTENQIKLLLNFCELNFEDKCLNFHENKRAVQTVSTMQVRQPIYSSSVKAWENYSKYIPFLFKNIKNY